MFMFGVLIYFFGLMSIFFNRNHILILFLCLEFMYLGILYNVVLFDGFKYDFLSMILFMILVVCEAGLGLSILVMGVYFYGNDKLNSMNLMKC
ncbi:NADH dehydrogenase subunit 4L (mitochondrion) [Ornithodoros turicata]|uniref:NADH-ubiquinone oxidoreductase chain 4L n=1 Tax=Ornithodoros turicata TaxID=34597 RepID=A0A3G2JZX0_9ACAR|nr:NADH dehydrogenase subunit 4L [Ornithodoros turicata]AYN50594.1 NADH dehydrogenase subunit 4L [Ornithodoros turicata]UYB78700.1 NADH dehydrogenase subunit 4L [Ornithodoros turicata]UYB78713.1 NADH dehydrogenase subunit 4L [Ornithodoros turicata]UYB78726.1 NADH dehydrogenase subunit 4L [Ornithodoros turicata]UYB78739.1 NADH dehydrogenase subunit 4L [Ornithodoros turicata]